MAVQEPGKETKVCDKCFASVPADAPYCPDCGAPLGEGVAVGDTDPKVYPELAKANLLRLRGEYKQAEDQCLNILRRYPNSSAVNTLLGDICANRGDIDQAAQWYELALDINPDSTVDRDKLAAAKAQLKRNETTSTAEQLGLPPPPSRAGLYVLAALALLLVLGVVAFAMKGYRAGSEPGTVTTPPIQVAPPDNAAPVRQTDEPSTAAAKPQTQSDDAKGSQSNIFQALAASNPDSSRMLSAIEDPRSHAVTVTFSFGDGDDPRSIAGRLGRSVFEKLPDATIATLRGMKTNQLAYVGDVDKSHATQADSTPADPQNPNAWVERTLTNEWPAPTPPKPSTGNQPSGTGGDTAGAAPGSTA